MTAETEPEHDVVYLGDPTDPDEVRVFVCAIKDAKGKYEPRGALGMEYKGRKVVKRGWEWLAGSRCARPSGALRAVASTSGRTVRGARCWP